MKDNEKDKMARETRTAYAESSELPGGQLPSQTAVIKELTARIDSLEEKVRLLRLSLVRRGLDCWNRKRRQ